MADKQTLSACLIAVLLFAGGTAAQDAPSWRALQEQPSRPDVPPEVERPKYEFSVSRDELTGFAPRSDSAFPDPSSDEAPVAPPADPGSASASAPPRQGAPAGVAAEQLKAIESAVESEPAPEEAFAVTTLREPAPIERRPEATPEEAGVNGDGPVDSLPTDLELLLESSTNEGLGLAHVDSAPAAVESEDRRTPITAVSDDGWTAAPDQSTEAASRPAVDPEPVLEQNSGTDPNQGYRLIRKRMVQPEYPRPAYRAGLEGWVNLRVTVAPGGDVEDVEVLAAKPGRVFNQSALRAVRQWRFEPPSQAGLSTSQSGIYRISFTMNDR